VHSIPRRGDADDNHTLEAPEFSRNSSSPRFVRFAGARAPRVSSATRLSLHASDRRCSGQHLSEAGYNKHSSAEVIITAMSPVLDKARLSAAIATARAAQLASRTLRTGGGSTVPGVVARSVDPTVLTKLSKRLARGSVAITGTNGKTTTTRMVGKILQTAGVRVVNNSTGANLVTGVTAALISDASLLGRPASEMGLFEVDEASVPKVASEVDLFLLAVLNLFRDQLDRYGELSYVAKVIASAFEDLSPSGSVVLNADDPLVASLGRTAARPVFFGVEDPVLDTGTLQHVADSKDCPVCGTALRYEAVYFGHVGTYRCLNCSFDRPEPAYRATNIRMDGPQGTDFLLGTPQGEYEARIELPGLYNVYNALAAATVAGKVGVSAETVVQGLRGFGGAFGRVERIRAGEKEVFLLLIKNPIGFNEILRTFVASPADKAGADASRHVLISINDNHADGRDISWLWDVDFEMLASAGADTRAEFSVSGIRAEDMAVRLKYAELPVASVIPDRKEALTKTLDATPPNETLYVLATYTAMLELRQILSDLGYTHPFWEDR
jgi:UDP-N-acetylmuramyl tripeptide synthase